VRNNTAWHNNLDNLNTGTWRAELSNQQSSHNTWVNNVAISDPTVNGNNTAVGNYSYGGYVNTGTAWHNNITFNGTIGNASVKTDGGNTGLSVADGNKLGVNPLLQQPSTDFHLQDGSPAINAGTSSYGLGSTDLYGGPRAVGVVDIGADERDSTITPPSQEPSITFNDVSAWKVSGAATKTVRGGDANDTIVGTTGNDSMIGGKGADVMKGGAGDDTYSVDNTYDSVVELTGQGTDTVNLLTRTHTLAANVENLNIKSSMGGTVNGNDLMNIVVGGTGNDVIAGRGGADLLTGGTGRDTFVYNSLSDKGDVIRDFKQGEDVIDLRPLTASLTGEKLIFANVQGGLAVVVEQNEVDHGMVFLVGVTVDHLAIGTDILI